MGKKWREALEKLGTWKSKKGIRAVHKPLLLLYLLARAQRGGSRQVAYAELQPIIKKALHLFGPHRATYHPESPFWYMRNDGMWVLPDADELKLSKGKSNEPSSRLLLSKNTFGEVPADYWEELTKDPCEASMLAQLLLDEFWPATYHQGIASHFGLELDIDGARIALKNKRKRDPNFRIEVLRVYEQKCAICGYNARMSDRLFGLEAAHIKWFSEGGPDQANNGLALCSLHHVAFDQGAIGLSENLCVQVSQDVVGSNAVVYAIVADRGKPI